MRGKTSQRDDAQQIPYSAFKQKLSAGQVESVRIEGQLIKGQLAEGDEAHSTFRTIKPPFDDPGLMTSLEEQEVEVHARNAERGTWSTLLISAVPWLLILGLFLFMSWRMRKAAQKMGGGNGGPFGMASSGAKRFKKQHVRTRFSDVAGLEGAKADLREVVDYLRDPKPYRDMGAEIPRGTLLMGPPGTGKTLLARAVAGEANAPFFSISGSEFIQMFVGVGASRVRDLFKEAKKVAPAIIFIDEVDAIGRARGTGLGGGHDEREQTLNQILSEMDGFDQSEAVMVLAGTNRPDVLDKALLRPGRFDRKVLMDLPRLEARKRILELHTKKLPLAEDIDLDALARATAGFSGADLKNLSNEAAMLAVRRHRSSSKPGQPLIARDEFDEALDRVRMGHPREGGLSDKERKLTAVHEAGHAILGSVLPHADRVRKVTILPRGQALGATEQVPDEDQSFITSKQLLDRITVLLGGRAAVARELGARTSGASNDLERATQLARKMVSQFGMSERLGAVSFKYDEEHVFLGREMNQQRNFSERTAQIIDEEIGRIIGECETRADRLLDEHQGAFAALTDALLKQETVDASEIAQIISTQKAA